MEKTKSRRKKSSNHTPAEKESFQSGPPLTLQAVAQTLSVQDLHGLRTIEKIVDEKAMEGMFFWAHQKMERQFKDYIAKGESNYLTMVEMALAIDRVKRPIAREERERPEVPPGRSGTCGRSEGFARGKRTPYNYRGR